MNNVVAVVVTYNRLEILKECIKALLIQQRHCDILIVDNNSTDDTRQWCKTIKDGFPEYRLTADIRYFNTGENIGGAGGFNFGMKKAVELGYEYVWVMDDDCIPFNDTLAELMEANHDIKEYGPEEYGFLSSVVLWKDRKECKMNRQKIKKTYFDHINLLSLGNIQVEQATFVSLLFPVETIKKVGLPVKDFFIWGDDIEYTRRITVRHNLPSFMVGKSIVVHAMKDNNGSSIALDAPERINRYKYAFRNEAYLYRKEGIKGICYYLAKCGLNFFRILFKAKNHRIKRCWVLLTSMVRGLFFNPKIEYL